MTAPIPESEKPSGPEVPLSDLGRCKLSGRVSYDGKHVMVGRLFFQNKQGLIPAAGVIHPDGTYEAERLPAGETWIHVLLDPKGELPFPVTQNSATPRGDGPPPALPPQHGRFRPKGARVAVAIDDPPPTGPEDQPVEGAHEPPSPDDVILPKGFPDAIYLQLVNYEVPRHEVATYVKLHRKYSQPAGPGALKCVLQPGENTYDIVMSLKN